MSISSEPVVLVHPLVIVGIQGIRSIPENTFSLQSTGVINVQQMQRHFEYKIWWETLYDGFEFSDDLRRVCDGPARDLTASNFSEIDFLKSIAKLRRVVRFAMNITCLRSI